MFLLYITDDSDITEDIIHACEHADNATLRVSCTDSKVIHIRSAIYGRKEKDPGFCSCAAATCKICDTNCGNITDSSRRVKDECEGQQFCNFTAHNEFFGDPCRGTCKYVQLTYHA